ncbi:hypothetical protein J2Z69_003498 [Paenibacillus shirakamiensis]|uniref:Uncharacterized protein n=1 Tax=Paenibacillus shirakamiensis TaxID=1265935 RepID=A0ABS4JL22_9BACL|nr:hypothetical protein [Paenibacillus shirakamiensis]MBP2002425.1 hypothetical protein [Paenibacillus shirakamiensis]
MYLLIPSSYQSSDRAGLDMHKFGQLLEQRRVKKYGEEDERTWIAAQRFGTSQSRFMALYLLKDTSTFRYYYRRKLELGLDDVFNVIICSLYYEKEKSQLKQELIRSLKLTQNLVTEEVALFQIKQFNRDLHALLSEERQMSITPWSDVRSATTV